MLEVVPDPATKTRNRSPFLQAVRSTFKRSARDPARVRSAWLEPLRKRAISRFEELGMPTAANEEWRFTSTEPIERVPFRSASPGEGWAPSAGAVRRGLWGSEDSPRLVFLNGRFAPELSSTGALPPGVRLVSLAEAFETDRGRLEAHLSREDEEDGHPFAALNSAFLEDGAFLSLSEGVVVPEPILLLFLSRANGDPLVSHPRILVLAGAGSQATIIESYAGSGPGAYFTNGITEIVAGAESVLDHYKLQNEARHAFHVARLSARLAGKSVLTSRSISIGGALVRNDILAVLDGAGAECTLDGLFLGTGTQHVDNHTTIDHAKPHGTSRETYKGILDGRSRGVFDGKIVVRPDAQKTDARQANRNLLLSDGALINTKPQLEIRADDVKCAHAATIGRLDEAALFYLRSRALGLEEARGLLIHGFASEIIDRMRIAGIRRRLDETLSRLLHAVDPRGEDA